MKLKHTLNDINVDDAFPNYTSYDDIVKTGESGPQSNMWTKLLSRVGLLVNILLGNNPNPTEITSMQKFSDDAPEPVLDKLTTDKQIALLTEFNSSFIRSTIIPSASPSAPELSTGNIYKMYEYKIDNNNKISARSFFKLIEDNSDFERAGSEGAIVGEEKAVEEIEELLASVVVDATGKLVKATMSIVGSEQDDTFKNDTYYLLGYSDNKKFKDKLGKRLYLHQLLVDRKRKLKNLL